MKDGQSNVNGRLVNFFEKNTYHSSPPLSTLDPNPNSTLWLQGSCLSEPAASPAPVPAPAPAPTPDDDCCCDDDDDDGILDILFDLLDRLLVCDDCGDCDNRCLLDLLNIILCPIINLLDTLLCPILRLVEDIIDLLAGRQWLGRISSCGKCRQKTVVENIFEQL